MKKYDYDITSVPRLTHAQSISGNQWSLAETVLDKMDYMGFRVGLTTVTQAMTASAEASSPQATLGESVRICTLCSRER